VPFFLVPEARNIQHFHCTSLFFLPNNNNKQNFHHICICTNCHSCVAGTLIASMYHMYRLKANSYSNQKRSLFKHTMTNPLAGYQNVYRFSSEDMPRRYSSAMRSVLSPAQRVAFFPDKICQKDRAQRELSISCPFAF